MSRFSTYSLVGLALLLVGCGGQAPVSGLTNPVQNFTEGKTALDAALQLPENSNPASQLSEATYKLNTSYSQAPTPQRAAAYAVAATAKVSNEIAQLFGTSINRSRSEGKSVVHQFALGLAPWKTNTFGMDSSTNPASILLSFGSGKTETTREYPDDPTPAQVRGALKAVENDLRRILEVLTPANLEEIELSPLDMDDPTSTDPAKRVKVGKAEGTAIRATSQAMLGLLDLVLAYDFSFTSGSFDFDQAMTVAFGAAVQSGTTINASSLLPSAPFGGVYEGGSARLLLMVSDWLGSAIDTKTAADLLLARTASAPGTTPWLGEVIGYSNSDLEDMRGDAMEMKTNLEGAGSIKLNGQTVATNIPAFAANPVGLSSMLPNLTPSVVSSKYRFAPIEGSWNSTFGGLFPNGVKYGTVDVPSNENRFKLVEELLGSLRPLSAAN